MNFTSDNSFGVAEPILNAVAAANGGTAPSYGGDQLTAKVSKRFEDLFDHEVDVFLVPTGTAANALSIAAVTPPWGTVFCHAESHIELEECGAAEFYTGGAKLVAIAGFAGKIEPNAFEAALARYPDHHNDTVPSALSITQTTECGTLYRPEEIRALAAIAHKSDLAVHMDGARFANAVAALGLAPADVTWRSGIDILSFGATKNGAIAAEAVIVFDRSRSRDLAYRRKRGGHLLSKTRFMAAQLDAYLEDGLWLELAGHANAMAKRLASGLAQIEGVRIPWPVEANEVFPVLPSKLAQTMRAEGAAFHDWTTVGLVGHPDAPSHGESFVRLVASFDTRQDDVDRFIALLRARTDDLLAAR